jgi:hypothetical protein
MHNFNDYNNNQDCEKLLMNFLFNQIGVTIGKTPVTRTDPPGYQMAWKYGYGNWIECNSSVFDPIKCNKTNGIV